MPVALHHLLRLVSDPGIDDALVDPLGCTTRTEAVPKDMPSFQDLPLAPFERCTEAV